MPRGKIIQYNTQTGEGIVVVEGSQYDFSIRLWKSEVAPGPNRVVEVELNDGLICAVGIVPDDVLMREKAAELTGKLSAAFGQDGVDARGLLARLVTETGKPALIALAVYFVATLFLPTIGAMGQSVALWDALAFQGSGWRFLLFLAWISPVITFFVPNRHAAWAMLLPLLVILGVTWNAYSQMSSMGAYAPGFFDAFRQYIHLGFGYYLAIVSGAFLAFTAFKKWAVQPA